MVDKTDEEMAELVDTLDLPIEATTTYEKWQEALERRLGYEPSSLLLERTWKGVPVLYESLPEVGIAYRRVEMTWGWQGQFVSVDPRMTLIPAGRLMSLASVQELTRGLR